MLRPRQQMRAFMTMWRMDIQIQSYVIRVGFYDIYRLGHIEIDWPLITSLVERWRLETHTFHVSVGEMTITLQDVTILLGLRIHGLAVTGTCVFDVAALCAELLGVIPPADAIRGATISLRWLCFQLSTPPPDADEVTLERCAWVHLSADRILLVCRQEGCACSHVLSPATARFDAYCDI